MAEIKVSQLPEASEINDADLLMIVQSGTNKKITKANARFASGDEISIGTTEPTEEEKIWIKSDETTDQARYKDGNTWKKLSIKALDSMVIGSVIQFVGTTIPTGWLECDGSTITQSAYPELYDLIGGTLPDFRGRVLVGQDTNDTDFDTLLETGGSKELQAHKHQIYVDRNTGTQGTGNYYPVNQITTASTYVDNNVCEPYGTGNSGNLQPYAVVKHIIKAKNTTPTMASIVNDYSESTIDGYSCDYVNGINTYSTNEVDTGKTWIDGKKIYRKVVDCGAMPSATTKQVPSGLTNVFITQIYGVMYNSGATITLSDVNPSGVEYSLRLFYSYGNNTIGLTTSADRSTYNGYVILEYTKTTD